MEARGQWKAEDRSKTHRKYGPRHGQAICDSKRNRCFSVEKFQELMQKYMHGIIRHQTENGKYSEEMKM